MSHTKVRGKAIVTGASGFVGSHLAEHLRFAGECQVPAVIAAENGAVLRLHPGPAEIVGHVTAGRFAVDGKRILRIDGEVLRTRRRLGFGGIALATVVLDEDGGLRTPPMLALPGLADSEDADDKIRLAALDAITTCLEELGGAARRRDSDVAETVRRAVRRTVSEATGRRPLTKVHVVRI